MGKGSTIVIVTVTVVTSANFILNFVCFLPQQTDVLGRGSMIKNYFCGAQKLLWLSGGTNIGVQIGVSCYKASFYPDIIFPVRGFVFSFLKQFIAQCCFIE